MNESVIPIAQLKFHNLTVDNLTKGEYYTVNVTATNSVGMSEPFQSSFTVPCKYCVCQCTVHL